MDDINPDIMAINESWLRVGQEDSAPNLAGYRLYLTPRPDYIKEGRGGGVGFYVRKGMRVHVISHPVVPTVEQMWLRLSVCGKTIVIGTAYRPPWLNVGTFLDALTDSISSFLGCDNLILLGDFNIDMLEPSDNKTKLLLQFLRCMNLSQLISEPTHFTSHSQTLIDVVCTDAVVSNVCVKHNPDLGAHAMLLVEFRIKKDKPSPRFVTYRPLNNILLDLFTKDLDSVDWAYLVRTEDVNVMASELTSTFLTLFDLHAPIKTTRFKGPPHPWITDTVKTMIRIRNGYHERFKTVKSDDLRNSYKVMKQLVVQAILSEKTAYFTHHINNNIKNSKKLWKNLKSNIVPDKKQAAELPPQFVDPDMINCHFLNVPGEDSVSISLLTYFEHHRYSSDTFALSPVSESTILKIVQGFKSNAQGIDGISLDMVVMTFPQSLPVITAIINESIASGTFPDCWKLAVIKPIPKKSNPASVNDLRPISLLPCLSKILEKVVCIQLIKYLEEHNILPQLQSGFRRGHSTSTALLDVVDNLLLAQDQGMCSVLVLLDFSRAFDSINISLLLSKLAFYGFTSNSIKWFENYLSNRRQCVELRMADGSSVRSAWQSVPRGVPQGSILGPILFILYSADIIKNISHCQFHLYADDLQLYYSFLPRDTRRAVNYINHDLSCVFQWSHSNSLVLNPKKSKFVLTGSKANIHKLNLEDISIVVGGEPVEYVTEAKSLGLVIDSQLKFESQVSESVRSCFYKLKVLYQIRPYLSEAVRISLCESLILSKLNYCDVVFGPCLFGKTEKLLQRVQNACARFCFHIPPRSHVTPYLNASNMLKMKARRDLHLASLLFGVIKHKCPPYLFNKLEWAREDSRYPSRTCSLVFVTKKHRTVAFRGSFRFAASRCWNDLPPPLRALKSLYTFKLKLKQELLAVQKSI